MVRHRWGLDHGKAAGDQLSQHGRLGGTVKPHDASVRAQVAQLADDHGFLLTNEGTQLYFHRNSVMNDDFAALKIGDAVQFVAADGDTGPTASKVWLGPQARRD